MATVLEQVEAAPMVLRLTPALDLTDDQFFDLCQLNRDWRMERTSGGDIVIMAPAGAESGSANADLTMQLVAWAKRDGRGVAFDSNAGFRLSNGATRSPDGSWVLRSRLAEFTREEKQKFLALCPDFVVELKSPSDRLADLKDKMEEYRENGARLGWLLDPDSRRAYVYRPNEAVAELDNPDRISGDPELPGFVLELAGIWEPDL